VTRIRSHRVKNGTKELQRIMASFKGRSKVKVGFPTGVDDEILNKAVWNEFGTEHIPERPFIRNGLRDGVGELKRVSRLVAARVVDGNLTTRQALNQLGKTGADLVKQSAIDLKDPPNAEVTVSRKGSSNPLIDTNEMVGSVTWEVE